MTLGQMIALAATKHQHQKDLAGQPYILHPIRVMQQMPNDPELQMIAVGHDLFEDTDVTAEYLLSLGCSERVITGIWALTRQSKESRTLYLHRVQANQDAKLVKLADLADNLNLLRLSSLTAKDLARAQMYHQEYRLLNRQ